jgi:hypothetical protein
LKLLYLFLVFLLSFSAHAEYDISACSKLKGGKDNQTILVYVNGINTTKLEAQSSLIGICDTLYNSGLRNLSVALYHNPKNAIDAAPFSADDFGELKIQAILSDDAINGARNLPAPFAQYDQWSEFQKYYWRLGEAYNNYTTNFASRNAIAYSAGADAGSVNIDAVVNMLQDKISDYIINKNKKIILLAHSQGNFVTEAAFARLFNSSSNNSSFSNLKYSKEEYKKILANIKFVGIAPVSYTVPGGKYILATQDLAVNALLSSPKPTSKLKYFTSLNPNIQFCVQANVSYCQSYEVPVISTWEALKAALNDNKTAHSMNIFYNSDTYRDLITKKPVRLLIKEKVWDANVSVLDVSISRKSSSLLQRSLYSAFSLFGMGEAIAQVSSLHWYINESYTIKVTGAGFVGNEDVEVDGSTCLASSIRRGNDYFTKDCTGGNVAGDAKRIRVHDTFGLGIETPAAFQTMSLRGPILAPNSPTLADLGSGSVRVTWGAVAGVTSYEVYRGATMVRTVAADTLTITDTGLTAGVSACYTIRAIANGAASQSSSNACITPAAPAVKCSGLWTAGQYNLGQTEQQTQACAAGYTGSKVLTHTCQAGTAGSAVGAWGTTSMQDNCVVVAPVSCLGSWSSTRYNVGQVEEQFANTCPAGSQGQVRTFHTCLAGGSWSANAQSDNCVAVLVAPTGLSASSVSAAQNGVAGIRLVWTAVSGATRYYITRNGSANYSSQVGTNWTDPNAIAGVQYCYTINAFSSFNNSQSAESSQVCTTYQPTQVSVSPPTNVAAARYTTGGRKDILLTWTPPSPAPDSYQVFRRDRSGMLAPLGGTETSFFDRYELNLTSGISYCYFIRSEKGGIISTESNEACSLAP